MDASDTARVHRARGLGARWWRRRTGWVGLGGWRRLALVRGGEHRRALLVLEEHERVAPGDADRFDRLGPGGEPGRRVVDRAQPEVSPVRGRQDRRGAV